MYIQLALCFYKFRQVTRFLIHTQILHSVQNTRIRCSQQTTKSSSIQAGVFVSHLKSLAFRAALYWKVTVNNDWTLSEKERKLQFGKRLRSIAALRALDRLRSSSTNGFCDEFEENHKKVSWNVFNTPRARTFDFPALFKTLVNESVDFVTVLFTSIFSLS